MHVGFFSCFLEVTAAPQDLARIRDFTQPDPADRNRRVRLACVWVSRVLVSLA